MHEYLRPLFDMMKDENKLLKAVHHDLEVSSVLARCQALWLINKFITVPLWRVLCKKICNFDGYECTIPATVGLFSRIHPSANR